MSHNKHFILEDTLIFKCATSSLPIKNASMKDNTANGICIELFPFKSGEELIEILLLYHAHSVLQKC